jgi:tetratricopeptide (TPR) repeat protein
MLREVVATDPRNETAIYNLGLLSMRSNQYEKAIGRFEDLLTINPKHLKGNYFLAVSYKEAGKKEKAVEYFKKVKAMDSDPAVQDAVTQALADLEAL